MNKDKKYFSAQDDSCHWYKIPIELKEQWERLNEAAETFKPNYDNPDEFDPIEEINDKFGQYRTGGGPA